MNSKLIEMRIVAEVVIEKNLSEIHKAYERGYMMAMYDKHQIGLKHAYDKLNLLLPNGYRNNLSFGEAMQLNSAIQSFLSTKLKGISYGKEKQTIS
ncbi:hypothetical protein DRH27_04720 [Candidatus Falkowbacteria bacterium]|nr:MAG: hypothetical protein DRH27_04720 [Candidatus Falkowbacteria bacterium]